jgi:hypothetical protein
MSASQRYILKSIGAGPSPRPDEEMFTFLVRRRLEQPEERVYTPPAREGMDALPAEVRTQPEWFGAPAARWSFAARLPVHWRPGFVVKGSLSFKRSSVAVAAFSGAMLGIVGYALSISEATLSTTVGIQSALALHAEPGDASTSIQRPSAIKVAAIAPSGPLYDEWTEPLLAKPESLAKTPPKAASKPAPVARDGGGVSETAFARPSPRTLNKVMEDALLARASNLSQLGDIAGAQSIFMSLAYQGSERAAFGLAETYEAGFLKSHHVIGMKPNPRLALEWFEKAASLGSEDAARRLENLRRAE